MTIDPEILGVLAHTARKQQEATAQLLKQLGQVLSKLDTAVGAAGGAVKDVRDVLVQADAVAAKLAAAAHDGAHDGAKAAVGPAMTKAMDEVGLTAKIALERAVGSMLPRFSDLSATAIYAELQMKSAVNWITWKVTALTAGAVIAVCLVAACFVQWQRDDYDKLVQRNSKLIRDNAELDAVVEADKATVRQLQASMARIEAQQRELRLLRQGAAAER